MNLNIISLPPLGANCHFISNDDEVIIVDPGGGAESVINFINNEKLKPIAILCTHGHFDHVGAITPLKSQYPEIPVYIHKSDYELMKMAPEVSQYYTKSKVIAPDANMFFDSDCLLELSDFSINVLHTPGHTPGSVSFYISSHGIVITGDTLFYRTVGRTDFPGGNFNDIERSIREKLYTLPDDTIVYPGHDKSSTIGFEKANNREVRLLA